MPPVNQELAIPFGAEPIHAEAWVRAERPSPERVEALINAQPEEYRPTVRRLLEGAVKIVEAEGPAEPAALEDPVVVEAVDAEAVEAAPVVEDPIHDLLPEVEVVEHAIPAPAETLTRVDPEPTPEQVAASAAVIDAALEDDEDA